MKQNMGRADRIIRIIAAALFIDLYFSHFVTGWLGIVLLVVACVFLLTSLVGSCPFYGICGIRTNRSKKTAS
jgi:hypothetical protein